MTTYTRHTRTLLAALFFVALVGNLIPRAEGAFPAETVSELRR